MLYRGEFKNISDDMITVYIQTDRNSDEIVEIGEEGGDLFFDKDPINIEMDVTNTFDIMFIKSCEINLITKRYLGDTLFTGNSRSVIVNVWKNTDCIFAGFLEPNIYTQPFDHYLDELTLNATDALGTFQYYNYEKIANVYDYNARRNKYGEVTFSFVLNSIFRSIPTLNLHTGAINNIYYDGSIRIPQFETQVDVFSNIKIGEMVWLGDEFDDIKTEDEVLESIFQYLDLKVRQEGCNFYIYSLQSIYSSKPINWYPILIPDVYIREERQYAPPANKGEKPREILTNSTTGEQILGNDLEEELSTDVETTFDINGNEIFVNFYYVILPSGEKMKTERYELAQSIDKDVLEIDGVKKILHQNDDGSYEWKTMNVVGDGLAQPNNTYTISVDIDEDTEDEDSEEKDIVG